MIDQESAGLLAGYPQHIRALLEDAAKTLNFSIDKPTDDDIAKGKVTIIPASTQLADAHYNAGYLRRSCQNHGVHMYWDGELKPDDFGVVCNFRFVTVEEFQRKRDADALAKAAPATPIATTPVKPAAVESKTPAAPSK